LLLWAARAFGAQCGTALYFCGALAPPHKNLQKPKKTHQIFESIRAAASF